MEKSKIAIIGHFGGEENILDGQTIKTKILYEELSQNSDWDIRKVDTYYKSKAPFKLLKDTIKTIFSTKKVIILLSGNGMKFYFPLLYYANKILGLKVYHDVIGGNLAQYVTQYPKFKKYLNSFEVNWVETNSIKESLEAVQIMNCFVIPNFKRLSILYNSKKYKREHFEFCIFSRVMREKGIEDAISAIQSINTEAGEEICKLDIYGKIDEMYTERFNNLLNNCTEAIKYKGMVPYQKSVDVIKDYYALLFPTFWKGEGFPGTIIDAFSAGIPVIATDWNCNGEIVVNKKNGILYPNYEIKNLKQAILWCIDHQKEMILMRENCLYFAELYQPDRYVKEIIDKIES